MGFGDGEMEGKIARGQGTQKKKIIFHTCFLFYYLALNLSGHE